MKSQNDTNGTNGMSKRNKRLQESLKQTITADNKGFQLLVKMGYKPGQRLGKQPETAAQKAMANNRITEPVGINIKIGRGGLGREAALREDKEKKKLHRQQRRLEKLGNSEEINAATALNVCQKTCENMDTGEELECLCSHRTDQSLTKKKKRILSEYKIALNLIDQFGKNATVTKKQKKRLKWAWNRVENYRNYISDREEFGAADAACLDEIKEKEANKHEKSQKPESEETNAETALNNCQKSCDNLDTVEELEILRTEQEKKAKRERRYLSQYSASLKVISRLGNASTLTEKQNASLKWAHRTVEFCRTNFPDKKEFCAVDAACLIEIKEKEANENVKSQEQKSDKPSTSHAPKANELSKQQLIVELLDQSNPLGQMTIEQWKVVENNLIELLFEQTKLAPEKPFPTFDSTELLNGVGIIKCNDEQTVRWIQDAAPLIPSLWSGANLAIAVNSEILSLSKAKVLLPRTVEPKVALSLLQRQNPDVPTWNWRILHVGKPQTPDGGQDYILQISKAAEDLLYPRSGKMYWGLETVFLRFERRHPNDGNENTLEAGELEKDLELLELATS